MQGRDIRAARKAAGVTQEELVDRMNIAVGGFSVGALIAIENERIGVSEASAEQFIAAIDAIRAEKEAGR